MANIQTYESNDIKVMPSSSSIDSQWSADDWARTEQPLNGFDKQVLTIMLSTVNKLFGIDDQVEINSNTVKVIGDDFYELMDKKLNPLKSKKGEKEKGKEDKKEPQKKVKKGTQQKDGKQLKKIDEMRMANAFNMIESEIDNYLKTFDWKDFHVPSAMKSKNLECRAIGFILMGRFLIQNQKKYIGKRSKIVFIYNIIVAIEKFLNTTRNFVGESIINASNKTEISEKLLDDLQSLLAELKLLYKFHGLNVSKYTPQLIIYTDYDSFIPNKTMKLYDTQVTLIEFLYNSIQQNKPCIATVRTPTGTGKTTTAGGIIHLALMLNKQLQKVAKEEKRDCDNELTVIFCCNMRTVMDQVGQIAFNAGLPLAMAYIDKIRGLRVVNNYNCKDGKPVVVICGPDACLEIFSKNKYPNCILFLDEPTIGADEKTKIAHQNVAIMTQLPKWTILSSATLPEKCFDWILESHEMRFGEYDYKDIYSNKILIGCEIKTENADIVLPHLKCTTKAELLSIIPRIKNSPFLGRTYTPNVVEQMYLQIKTLNIPSTPNIYDFFSNVDNLSANKVRDIAMELLESLALASDEDIKRITATKIDVIPFTELEKETKKDEDDDDIVWETEETLCVDKNVNYDLIGTTEAHKYLRPSLIACNDPVKFALDKFQNLITDIKKSIGSTSKLESQYKQEMSSWQKKMDRFDRTEKTDGEFKSTLDREQAQDALAEAKPIVKFPAQFQINTRDHIRKYAKKTSIAIDSSAIRSEIDCTNIVTKAFNVSEDLLLLLCAGIGIYTFSPDIDKRYFGLVLEYAEAGKLAYIISDSSIAYGTNYPINRVFVTKEFSDSHSLNTIYQLISRAGRVGKSWLAEAFIDDDCAKRIISMTRTITDNDNIEVKHLNELYLDIKATNDEKDKELLTELLRSKAEANAKAKAVADAKLKAEAEAKAKAEAEAKFKAEQERLKTEQEEVEKKKLDEIRLKRQQMSQRTVPLNTVVTTQPTHNIAIANEFKRESKTGVTSMNDRFARLQKLKK